MLRHGELHDTTPGGTGQHPRGLSVEGQISVLASQPVEGYLVIPAEGRLETRDRMHMGKYRMIRRL
jgi:hypothetical protein